MILRCNCAHRANPTSGTVNSSNSNAGMESVDTYVAPTRALILQLVNFPPSSLTSPSALREEFHSRGTSMKLKWQEQAPNGSSASSTSTPSTSAPSFSSTPSLSMHHSAALRLLGLSTEEAIAVTVRQRDLEARASVAGVTPAPASIYPPTFGQARMELASNDLALFELSRSSHHTITQTYGERFTHHLNPPVFLQPQISDQAYDSQSVSPFPVNPSFPVHSSIPLTTDAQRGGYIRAIVHHVAQRLGLSATSGREPSTAPTDAPTSSTAHILLLYLDAHILLGDSERVNPQVAGQFAEHLLTALATQLHSKSDDPSLEQAKTQLAGSPANYPPMIPPPLPASKPPQPTHISPASGSSHTSSPQHAASLLLSSPTVLCPHLVWSFLEPDVDSPPQAVRGNRMLDLIRPVQTFQVQDGFVDRRMHGWKSYHASVYHFDSMRVADKQWDHQVNPVHGELNLAHFIKEIVFKIGRGNKYGA